MAVANAVRCLNSLRIRKGDELSRYIEIAPGHAEDDLSRDPTVMNDIIVKYIEFCTDMELSTKEIYVLAFKRADKFGFNFGYFCEWAEASNCIETPVESILEEWINTYHNDNSAASSMVSGESTSKFIPVISKSTKRRRNSGNPIDDTDVPSDPEPENRCPLQSPPGDGSIANNLGATCSPKENVARDDHLKPKPIMAYGIKSEGLTSFAKAIKKEGPANFTLKMAGEYVKIFPETLQDKSDIEKILLKLKVNFYIISDHQRTFRVVIGKLIAEITEIEEELKLKGFDIVKVTRMTSRRDSKPLPLYIVHLSKKEDFVNIFKLRDLLHIRVNVEKLRPPKKATQCFRCNLFHHIAKNCRFQPKCGICSENHESMNCPSKSIPKEERPPPRCANCSENHVSSYKGCKNYPNRPSYAQVTTQKAKKREVQKAPPTRASSATPKFAQSSSHPKPIYEPQELRSDTNSLVELIQNLKSELQIPTFEELFSILKNALESISSQKDLLQKRLQFIDCLALKTPSSSSNGQSD